MEELKNILLEIEEKYGGDVTFIPPVSPPKIHQAEIELNFKLPLIFSYFYEKESNGMQIDNKVIYSIFDKSQRKTYVENIQRVNNPSTSPWFKNKPEVFEDYLIIGADRHICFTIYKHRKIDNPSIYMCENPNTKGEVILERLDMNLAGLIYTMIENSF